jgi:hypothetical protein
MTGHINITDQAMRLYHASVRAFGEGELAMHIVWRLGRDGTGDWFLGFSPESHILAADAKIQEFIVAGRCRGIIVVVDGPMPKTAKEMKVDIDIADGHHFKVTVTE